MPQSSHSLVTHQLDFAIVLVRDSPIESTPDRICAALECARRNAGDVISFDASQLLISFAASANGGGPAECRRQFIAELQGAGSGDFSVVHGTRQALVGDVGTSHRRSVTFMFEGYRECLRELVALPLGAVKEV